MKETVIDIQDLQEMVPLLRGRVGRLLGKCLIKLLSIDKVNQVHKNSCHLRGAAFTTALLKDPLIQVKYKVHHEERLENLPEGAFITVSNHPIGSLDGIVLIDMMASRRPDFKVMVNGILNKIGAMEDNFIPVQPDTKRAGGGNPANINGVRLSLQQLHDGHPMGFFPAGAMSFYNTTEKKVRDLTWARSVIRLIRKANVPVYPVFFDFQNSRLFYWLGRISWKIRTLRVACEVFNKQGKTIDVYIGAPILPEEIQAIPDDKQLADYLYQKTYGSK